MYFDFLVSLTDGFKFHKLTFSWIYNKPVSADSILFVRTCASDWFFDSRAISSTQVGAVTSEVPIFTPSRQFCSWSKSVLFKLLYISVDNFAPCGIPCFKMILRLSSPSHFTRVFIPHEVTAL